MYAAAAPPPPPTIPTCQICCLSICGLIKRQLQAGKPPNGRVRQTVGFASVKSFKSDPYFRPLGCPFFRPTLNQESCTQTHTDTHRGTLCCYRMQTQTNSISINLHRIERDVLILFDFPWIFHEFSAPDRDNEPVFKVWRVEINLKKSRVKHTPHYRRAKTSGQEHLSPAKYVIHFHSITPFHAILHWDGIITTQLHP